MHTIQHMETASNYIHCHYRAKDQFSYVIEEATKM